MDDIAAAWNLELVVVRGTHDGGARRSLSRDVARGLLLHVRQGAYVERVAFERLTPEAQHLVRMRALAATADGPVVFSHWSAAVLQGIPVLRERLGRVHTTVDAHSSRARTGTTGHLLRLGASEVEQAGPLLVTARGRTVVDLAAAAPFHEGVMAADHALRMGMPRNVLRGWIDAAGPRRAAKRIGEVADFAHPGAESAAESWTRVTLCRIGVEPPELQYRIVLADGREVFLDLFFRGFGVGAEVDGAVKLLDPVLAPDARLALLREKRREDAVRLRLAGLVRWGWAESGSTTRLRALLACVGVVPASPHATLADYAAAAREARPRVFVHG